MGVRGAADHPVNFGHLGPKGEHGWVANNSKARGTTPMIRRTKGAPLQPVSWDDFFREFDDNDVEFLYSPDTTSTLSLLYARPVTATLGINATLNGRYQSTSHADLAGTDLYAVDSYSVLNASVGVQTLDGRWDLTLWGSNLTDEYYWLTVTQGANTVIRFPGQARTYGASLTYRF